MKIPKDLKEFFDIMAYEENRPVDEIMLDALRHYKRVIQGQAEQELRSIVTGEENLGRDLISEFFIKEGLIV